MGHTWKRGLHLEQKVTLGKIGQTGKERGTHLNTSDTISDSAERN